MKCLCKSLKIFYPCFLLLFPSPLLLISLGTLSYCSTCTSIHIPPAFFYIHLVLKHIIHHLSFVSEQGFCNPCPTSQVLLSFSRFLQFGCFITKIIVVICTFMIPHLGFGSDQIIFFFFFWVLFI